MTFPDFIAAVDNLVREWEHNDPTRGRVPREALQKIFDDVREQAVHDLALAVQQRDQATRTHGMLITMDRQHRKETPP